MGDRHLSEAFQAKGARQAWVHRQEWVGSFEKFLLCVADDCSSTPRYVRAWSHTSARHAVSLPTARPQRLDFPTTPKSTQQYQLQRPGHSFRHYRPREAVNAHGRCGSKGHQRRI